MYNYISLENIGTFGSFNGEPEGITMDSEYRLIVNDEGRNSVAIFHSNRTILGYLGSKGSELGQFDSQDGICFDHNRQRLIVADQGNYRIQVFNYTEVLEYAKTYVPPTTETTGKGSPSFELYSIIILFLLIPILRKGKL